MKNNVATIIKILVMIAFLTSIFAPTAILAQANPPPAGPPPAGPPPPPAAPIIPAPVTEKSCGTLNLFCHLTKFLNWTILQIGYLIGLIVGLMITLGASIISFLIDINSGLTESLLVLTGFRITLSLANLGFVLVLILIAFGTIFRIQTYQMKTTLRNLIIAAILVNFSLVIAGLIIDFTGILSKFFINPLNVSGTSISSFADNLAAALNVQNLFTVTTTGTAGFFGSMLETLGGIVSGALSLFLLIFIGILTAIAFWGIAFMIIVRYVYLSILLILMPLAWLFWVTPRLSHLFTDWWKKFIQWTFFLPAVTFFIYLTIFSVNEIGALVRDKTSGLSSVTATNKIILNKGGLGGALQSIVLVGLLIGGLIAANSMGIKAGDGALGAAKGVKNWTLGKVKGGAKGIGKGVGRGALRGTTGWLGRKGPEQGAKSRAERLQGWAAKRKSPITRYLAGQVSRGVAGVSGVSEKQEVKRVKEAEKKVEGMTETQMLNALTTGLQPTKVAVLKKLTKDGKLKKVNMKNHLTDSTKKAFINLGEGKAFSDMEKGVGMNVEMMKALKTNDQDGINKASQKFIEGFSDADKKKVQFDDIYKEGSAFGLEEGDQKEMLQKGFTYGMSIDPGMIGKAYPKMKSKNLPNFDKKIFESIADMDFPDKAVTLQLYNLDELIKKSQSKDKKEAGAAKSKLLNLLKTANKKVYDSMTKNMANRITGMTFEPEAAPGGTPPTT